MTDMKIITCASFYASGSSALTDLVAEYSKVKGMSEYEFRFLHDPDGVYDLEHHLVHAHNRHNAGHALKRFEKLSRFNAGTSFNARYEPYFNNQYMKLTEEYIEELLDFKYNGWWFYDIYDKGKAYYYTVQLINKFLQKTKLTKKDILSKEVTYCSHPSEEKFLECTRAYVSKLMRAANSENAPFFGIDQIVPSQNLNQILRYFEDEIFVFIVDRDPRDIYLLNRMFFRDRVCPTEVNSFCDWYNYTRESGSTEVYDESRVKKIHFEDLIYNYEKSVAEVENFLGLDSTDHVNQFKKLNPQHSKNNTQIWTKHDLGLEEDIKIIEEKCAKYLYPFESVKNNEIPGIVVNNNKTF
jgi:hypothetical protein